MAFNITAGTGTIISADVYGSAAAPSSGQQTQWVGIACGTTGALAPVATGNPVYTSIQIGTTALVGGAGAVAAGVLRVTHASDDPVTTAVQLLDDAVFADDAAFTPATSKVLAVGLQADETATDSVDEGDIGCPRITLDRKQIVADYPHTAGGCSAYSALSTGAVLAAQIKGSAGQLYSMHFFNNGANEVFVRLYNQTGAPANTDTANIVWRGFVPGNAAGTATEVTWPKGLAFATGIGIRVTGAVADNDTTALSASEVAVNAGYK